MYFEKCRKIFGKSIILDNDLELKEYKGIIFDGWAFYKKNQQIISDSAFYGNSNYDLINSKETTKINYKNVRHYSGKYVWLGQIHDHFGHFIISSLSRIWALNVLPKEVLIAYVGPDKENIFNKPYMKYIFEVLGVNKDRFVNINNMGFFENIYIPERSLNENHSIHQIYADSLKFSNEILYSENDDYIYISKHNLKKGVMSIDNEEEVCNILSKNGIKIITPETISFKEQISVWENNRNFVGFSSSAFHMSNFFSGKNIISINRNNIASSNHLLSEKVCNNKSLNIFTGELIDMGKNENFSCRLRINNTGTFSENLLRVIEKFNNKNLSPQILPRLDRSVSYEIFRDEPLGGNISKKGIAAQSSIYKLDEGYSVDAQGALSGKLSGNYQCHTDLENNPWWQVDFGTECDIHEVRIYNRMGKKVYKRADSFSILASNDGENFSLVHENKESTNDFRWLGGKLYRWTPETYLSAKFIRIQLMKKEFLHFDQVEIFGEKTEIL